ncbi:MAG: PAS domain S-box protein [Arenicellales bacterium]
MDALFTLFNGERVLVLELDEQCRIVRWNRGFTAVTGYSAEKLMNAFPPDLLQAGAEKSNPETGTPGDYACQRMEKWLCTPDRACTVHWIKLWSHCDHGRRHFVKLGWYHQHGRETFGDDETSRHQLRAFLDATPDVVITINDQGTIVSVNPATEKLFGYRRSELTGRNLSLLMAAPDRERHDEYLKNYLETGKPKIIGTGRDILACRKDGKVFPARLSVCEFKSHGETYFTGMLQDISERVAADNRERAMFAEHAHTSRVVALGEMASSIAHEINQPLTAIVSFADASRKLLETERPDPETLKHALSQISRQGQRAGEIIRRLRQFVKKKEPDRSTVNINELIQAAVAMTKHDADRYGISLVLDLDPGALHTLVDRLQIEQVVLNLIRNSIEAINEQGGADGAITVRSRLREDMVAVSVSDNGPGIKPSEVPRIFDAFYSTKSTGTGLGLSISRSIAEAHDGSLTFEPDPDSGVTFTLLLPADAVETP